MSGYTILVAPRVRAQFSRILDWWEEHRPANPGLVAVEFKEALGVLAVAPVDLLHFAGSASSSGYRLKMSCSLNASRRSDAR